MELIELSQEKKAQFFMEVMRWDVKRIAIACNKKLQEYIKTGEGRFFAESYFLGQILEFRTENSSFFDDYKNHDNDLNKILQISAPSLLQRYFFDGKVFSMTKPVYDLLERTSNKVFLRKHPFPIFAIDQKVKTKYDGLSIIFSIFFEVGEEGGESKGCNYLAIGKDDRDDSDFWITGDILYPLKDCKITSSFPKEESRELHKIIRELYANFLDYINHPSARKTIYKLSWNNEKRMKRGQFPMQDKINIDIKSEFLNFIKLGESKTRTNNKFKKSFWVRGHFNHFRNKERYKRIYSLNEGELETENLFYNGDYISKWITPYIKGKGKLKQKIRRAV